MSKESAQAARASDCEESLCWFEDEIRQLRERMSKTLWELDNLKLVQAVRVVNQLVADLEAQGKPDS